MTDTEDEAALVEDLLQQVRKKNAAVAGRNTSSPQRDASNAQETSLAPAQSSISEHIGYTDLSSAIPTVIEPRKKASTTSPTANTAPSAPSNAISASTKYFADNLKMDPYSMSMHFTREDFILILRMSAELQWNSNSGTFEREHRQYISRQRLHESDLRRLKSRSVVHNKLRSLERSMVFNAVNGTRKQLAID